MRLFVLFFLFLVMGSISGCKEYPEYPELANNHNMTWVSNNEHKVSENSWVDCYGRSKEIGAELEKCNPYIGDTQCSMERPLLCLNKAAQLPEPIAIKESLEKYDRKWSGAELKITKPIKGTFLGSKEAGDLICADNFGKDWKMAEFHDGEGWGFWGKGLLPDKSRFWVSINDQPANCWDKSQHLNP